MIENVTRSDLRLKSTVERELEWAPEVDATAIGLVVKDGVVTLTGYIDTYSGKLAAERAVKRVHGVRAVANDIEVRVRFERTDPDIAQDAARALELRSTVPKGVQAAVHHAHVTLTGNVTWLFQKQAAEAAVRHVRGVHGIHNYIVVVPHSAEHDLQRRIVKALHRDADVDARHISATVSEATATLSGTVATWLQRESAERAAASAPGISHVDNHIIVEPLGGRDSDDAEEFS